MSEGKHEPVGLPYSEVPGVAVAVAAKLRFVKDSVVDTDDFGCGGGGRKGRLMKKQLSSLAQCSAKASAVGQSLTPQRRHSAEVALESA